MITLPTLSTQTVATGDADTSMSTDILSGADAMPQDFLTALGNQLLTLAKQPGKVTQLTDQLEESEADTKPTSALNALLAALENPDAVNALLKPENIKAATKSADDKDKQDASTLSASEMQNVQALFAMLPAAAANNATPAVASSELTQSDVPRNTLSSLSQAVNSALTSKDEAPEGKSSKASDNSALMGKTPVAASNTAAVSSNNNSNALNLDSSFQQVLSSLSKQDDQSAPKNSTSDNLLVTSAPISSASSLTAPLNASATTNTPSTPMLNAQLGSNEWQQALSQQIVMFSRNGQQNAELRLHPEDLGAIQISLKLDNDTAQLNMVSSHSHVRAALEAALPQLRHALAESGINLGESQVSSDSSAQGQSFQQQQEARRDGQHGRFSLSQDSDNDITPIAVPATLQARVAGNGAVDTFA